jgi:type I restriction enzyme S subunit
MNIKHIKFLDFVTLQRGFDLPKSLMKNGEVPVLGSNCIIGYHDAAKVDPPGVVTGRSGTLGLMQYIDSPYWPHNTSLWVKDFKGNYPKYVYYKMMTLHLENFNGGASVPTLNRNVLDTLPLSIPYYDTQVSIADILSTYDDLIENNRRQIELLEQAARLLYQEWFVRFRYPDHEHVKIVDGIPEGWKRKPLGECGKLNYGKALHTDNRISGPYPVYGSSGIIGTHEQAMVKGPGIILGRKGNIGSVSWSHNDYYPIDTVYFIDSEQSSYYLYFALLNTAFISTDVAVPGLNRDFAHSRLILFPSDRLLNFFNEQITPIHNQISKLQEYNRVLSNARDLLLPRLMGGEIVV